MQIVAGHELVSCLCNLVRMARPVRDAFGGRLLLLRRKTARLVGRGATNYKAKINKNQLKSTPVNSSQLQVKENQSEKQV